MKGFGLLEIIVGISIISAVIFGLTSVSQFSLKLADEALLNTKASFLLEEEMEAIRIMRDESWNSNILSLTPGNNYYFEYSGNIWKATSSNIYTDDIFERRFIIENVARDGNDDISLAGVNDPNTKKITVFLSWKGRNGTTTKQISGYIADLF